MMTMQRDRLSELVRGRTQMLARELRRAGGLSSPPAMTVLDDTTVATATSVGAKRVNQDSVLLFTPERSSRLRWAVAVADGVSSSAYSAAASNLACHAALANLKQAYAGAPSKAARWRLRARSRMSWCWCRSRNSAMRLPPGPCPVAHASRVLSDVTDRVERSSEFYRPEQVTKSSWMRTMRDGQFLQTTLMVAWQLDDRLHVQGVGDGGFTLWSSPAAYPLVYEPRSDIPVYCLGPKRPPQYGLYGMTFESWERFSLFTDGATKALSACPDLVAETLRRDRVAGSKNSASLALRWLLRHAAEHIDDNLTLLLVERRNRWIT